MLIYFSYLLKKKNPHGEKIVIIEQTAMIIWISIKIIKNNYS